MNHYKRYLPELIHMVIKLCNISYYLTVMILMVMFAASAAEFRWALHMGLGPSIAFIALALVSFYKMLEAVGS